jgi:hypothetical protein
VDGLLAQWWVHSGASARVWTLGSTRVSYTFYLWTNTAWVPPPDGLIFLYPRSQPVLRWLSMWRWPMYEPKTKATGPVDAHGQQRWDRLEQNAKVIWSAKWTIMCHVGCHCMAWSRGRSSVFWPSSSLIFPSPLHSDRITERPSESAPCPHTKLSTARPLADSAIEMLTEAASICARYKRHGGVAYAIAIEGCLGGRGKSWVHVSWNLCMSATSHQYSLPLFSINWFSF